MGKAPDEWSYGDLDAGFKSAALIVDETFVVQSTGHQPMETRSAMAYWQNGKLFLHGSTQSVARTIDPLASWLGIDASNIVLVSEYCGGGFGSKGAGAMSMVIPALLSKKSRRAGDDAHQPRGGALHRPRADRHGRAARRPASARTDASPRSISSSSRTTARTGRWATHRSAANAASLIWQPLAMRWRGVAVITNTPPRSQQRSPGPMQANAIMEPVVTKAAKKLGLDQVAIRRINSPEGKALYGPARPNGQRGHITSAFVKEGARSRRRALQVGRAQGAVRPAAGDRRCAASASPSDRTARARSATTA